MEKKRHYLNTTENDIHADGGRGWAVGRSFAASGSCFDDELYVKGTVNGNTFTSPQFSGTMDSQKFWDALGDFAKRMGMFVYLVY